MRAVHSRGQLDVRFIGRGTRRGNRRTVVLRPLDFVRIASFRPPRHASVAPSSGCRVRHGRCRIARLRGQPGIAPHSRSSHRDRRHANVDDPVRLRPQSQGRSRPIHVRVPRYRPSDLRERWPSHDEPGFGRSGHQIVLDVRGTAHAEPHVDLGAAARGRPLTGRGRRDDDLSRSASDARGGTTHHRWRVDGGLRAACREVGHRAGATCRKCLPRSWKRIPPTCRLPKCTTRQSFLIGQATRPWNTQTGITANAEHAGGATRRAQGTLNGSRNPARVASSRGIF